MIEPQSFCHVPSMVAIKVFVVFQIQLQSKFLSASKYGYNYGYKLSVCHIPSMVAINFLSSSKYGSKLGFCHLPSMVAIKVVVIFRVWLQSKFLSSSKYGCNDLLNGASIGGLCQNHSEREAD